MLECALFKTKWDFTKSSFATTTKSCTAGTLESRAQHMMLEHIQGKHQWPVRWSQVIYLAFKKTCFFFRATAWVVCSVVQSKNTDRVSSLEFEMLCLLKIACNDIHCLAVEVVHIFRLANCSVFRLSFSSVCIYGYWHLNKKLLVGDISWCHFNDLFSALIKCSFSYSGCVMNSLIIQHVYVNFLPSYHIKVNSQWDHTDVFKFFSARDPQ